MSLIQTIAFDTRFQLPCAISSKTSKRNPPLWLETMLEILLLFVFLPSIITGCMIPAGFFCDSTGMSLECPIGYVCPGGVQAGLQACFPSSACNLPGLSSQPPCDGWMLRSLDGEELISGMSGFNFNFSSSSGIVSGESASVIYVAETSAHRILKVVLSDSGAGMIFGSGIAGWEDGASSTARFYQPSGLAFDKELDTFLFRIRTTIAFDV